MTKQHEEIIRLAKGVFCSPKTLALVGVVNAIELQPLVTGFMEWFIATREDRLREFEANIEYAVTGIPPHVLAREHPSITAVGLYQSYIKLSLVKFTNRDPRIRDARISLQFRDSPAIFVQDSPKPMCAHMN